ncbi:hypothetical protein F511_23629 [Dorcoceras hygrometricum]|uniref:Uncharacterized protein n=1 Tax=Dorcoceras hygrometricum TaxID=472368 RepID=A0A2Z7CS97_9LAMI|nr:hypothetical protein F511_23629 [Dorcoceras hygrometricum]
MASSLYVNTVHVCFESVLAMDNVGMVAMFESLVATGLKVGKKKKTFKSKSVSAQDNLAILPVAQEAVPIQIIDPTPAAPAEQPPVPKRKIQKRKRSENTMGEPAVEVAEETVVEGIAEPVSEPAVADVANAVVSEKSNAIVGVVTTGFECLPPSCDGLTGPDDHGPMISTG